MPVITPSSNPPITPNVVLSGPVCPRYLVSTLKSWNTNIISAVYNIQWGTYWFFDNQPCIDHENEFSFRFVRNAVINGVPSKPEYIDIHLMHNQLVYMKAKSIKIWGHSYYFNTKFNKETYNIPSKWDIMPVIRQIEINRYLMGDGDNTLNDWTPESQGNKVDIAWHERDPSWCNSNTQTSSSYTIGGTVNLGVGDLSLGTVNWGTSVNNSQSYSITAANDVQIGVFQHSFCQNPMWPKFDKNKLFDFYAFENLLGSSNGDKMEVWTQWFE
ncbi:MAG: hypothetical protein R2774_07685 [Saprospiraceae bacterium]